MEVGEVRTKEEVGEREREEGGGGWSEIGW